MLKNNFKILVTTLYGLEEVLSKELSLLGGQDIVVKNRNVQVTGDLQFLYKANLNLRTAIRVLVPIHHFKVSNENEFYQKLKKIDWSQYFDVSNTFAIDTFLNQNEQLTTNSHYISLKCKDAIVDYFRETVHKRPNVDTENPDVRINVHIFNNLATISLDSSGDSLHRRGYRKSTNIAPINEVLAAGMLLMAGYTGKQSLLDPMCGSGTFLIEAAMIARNIPPSYHRKSFAFQSWKNYKPSLFEEIYKALEKKRLSHNPIIRGFDKAPSAVRKSIENSKSCGLEEAVEVFREDFFHSSKNWKTPEIILFNPPYGERLTVPTESFYKKIGDTLKQDYSGTSAWMITSDLDGLKFVGLRPSRRIPLKNGKLDCKFVKYELYQGSRKKKHNDDSQ